MRQGVSGVGDEINHSGQSHKFVDGNVHIVGADNSYPARRSPARHAQLDTSLQQHNPRRGPDRATKGQRQGERHKTAEGDVPCGVEWKRKRAYGDGMTQNGDAGLEQIGRAHV